MPIKFEHHATTLLFIVFPMTPITQIQSLLSDPTQINLDQLQAELIAVAKEWQQQQQLLQLYEQELQRELRAKVELCGGTPSCSDPDTITFLHGPALLAARREASHCFNQTFFIMPVSRTAQKPKSPEPNFSAPKTT